MDAYEPRVRRRGFFLHSTDINESDAGEHENPEGFPVRVRTTPLPSTQTLHRRPDRTSRGPVRRSATRNQIWERDWQPSTGTLAPLIQLEQGDARNATTAPTSSGRPKRPNGSSLVTNSAIP